jgi:DNA polymerase I-like protein with 3'-5' exonuclease and polymerase domains
MTRLAIDFETYWGNGYTLSSMSTEAYVRDSRFKAHGAAVSVDDGPSQWITGVDLPEYLKRFDWGRTVVLAHHAQFDGLILSHHYGAVAAAYICTMQMARGLGLQGSLKRLAKHFGLEPKGDALALSRNVRDLPEWVEAQIAPYSCHDNELAKQCLKKMSTMLPAHEYNLISNVIKMFVRPLMRIEPAGLKARIAEIEAKRLQLQTEAGLSRDQLMSNLQLAQFFRQEGIEPPKSMAKNNPGFLELLDHPNDRIALAVAARIGVKGTMESTRAQKLVGMGSRGAACVYINYGGAGTTRFSGGDGMNFQNLKRGSVLRTCLEAPAGYRLGVCDSRQVEARVLDWLAGQDDAVAKWASGVDQYKDLASELYPDREIDKALRNVGKVLKLGMGYGMGNTTLHTNLAGGMMGNPPLHISTAEAERYKNVYRNMHPQVVKLWWRADTWIEMMAEGQNATWKMLSIVPGGIVLPNGLKLRYPNLSLESDGWTYTNQHGATVKIYGSKLIQNVIEALTRDIVMRQLCIIAAEVPVLSTTHDEVVALLPEDRADEYTAWMQDEMRQVPDWALGAPVDAEASHSARYDK